MEIVNDRAFCLPDRHKYKLNVGDNIYGFDDLEFFQGLLNSIKSAKYI
jgi:hypothetical protein